MRLNKLPFYFLAVLVFLTVSVEAQTTRTRRPANRQTTNVSNMDISGGLKDALLQGVRNAISDLGRENGFLDNSNVRIPLPRNLQKIEKTLRKMGKDGDKVRGTLERDFAAYTQKAQKERHNRRNLLLFAIVQPLAIRGAKAAADFLFAPDPRSFQERLDAMRHQVDRGRAGVLGAPESETPPVDLPPTAAGTIADPGEPAR